MKGAKNRPESDNSTQLFVNLETDPPTIYSVQNNAPRRFFFKNCRPPKSEYGYLLGEMMRGQCISNCCIQPCGENLRFGRY